MSIPAVNQQTIIGLEESQIMGQKALRYFVREAPRPENNEKLTQYGSRRGIAAGPPSVRSEPTRLNELDDSYRLPINHGYLGSENESRTQVDKSTDLRFGGDVRALKSQQMAGELTAHRYTFIPPTIKQPKYSSKPLIITDNEFGIGNYGSSQPIPNYYSMGNNPILENMGGVGTRSALIENRKFKA